MKSPKVNLTVFFISLFVFVGTTGIFFIAKANMNLQEKDVTYFTAEIKSIEAQHSGFDVSYKIHTTKYIPYLLVTDGMDSNGLSDLKIGDKITFGVENEYVNLLKSDKKSNAQFFVTVVSLKTNDEEIFTLENYNQASKNNFNTPFVGIIIIVLVALFFLIKSSIAIINNKKKNNN